MNDAYEKFFVYFDRKVLASYRQSPEEYVLVEDDMGGELESVGADGGTPLHMRFALRHDAEGAVHLAALSFDIERLSNRDQRIWLAFRTKPTEFNEDDPAFERWVRRNLDAEWDVEDGPLLQLNALIQKINATTNYVLGVPLWKVVGNPLVNYPASENADAYAQAHLELYRVIGDGLSEDALTLIAARRSINARSARGKLDTLKAIMPPELITKVHAPLTKNREMRNRKHGVTKGVTSSFEAFATFDGDIRAIQSGLGELVDWLEREFGVDAESCVRREDALKAFPEIVGPPMPEFKLGLLQEAIGKTIQSVRFGAEASSESLHEREAIQFHFTDGTALCIAVNSNIGNLVSDFDGLTPSDFHTSIDPRWAPAVSLAAQASVRKADVVEGDGDGGG